MKAKIGCIFRLQRTAAVNEARTIHRLRRLTWSGAWLAISALVPLATHAAAGRTPTDFDVSSTGAAQYAIPIFTPPGTKGMQPSLTLTYSSRGGSGYFGFGWGLSGLSAMTRCGQTWAQNGAPRNVRNDLTDRLCLDGNQLRLVSGTYGANGAEYRTEIETFARIKSYSSAGSGPAYFVVEQKNGLIYEYGNTADSRIESVGQSTARTWMVNKIRDRAGNAILFNYTEDATNGSFRVNNIQYTQNTNAGLSPAYQVSFVYESVPVGEVDSKYQANAPIRRVTRAARIDVTHSGTLVRRYTLAYEALLSSTSKSRLASVQECAGSSGTDCLPATAFTYQNGTSGLAAQLSTSVSVPVGVRPWAVDVNADGRRDLVYSSSLNAGTWRVAFANSSGSYNTAVNTGIANTGWRDAVVIDYNNDGREDLLVPYSGSTWWVMLGTASGLASPSNTSIPVTATGKGDNARALDINGDGWQDLVWADKVGFSGGDAVRYRLREPAGTFSSTVYTLIGPLPANQQFYNVFGDAAQISARRVPDFNGDGRGCITTYKTTRTVSPTGVQSFSYSLAATCPGGTGFAASIPAPSTPPNFGDFNGDGLTDLLYVKNGTTPTLKVRYSTGTSFTDEVHVVSFSGGYDFYPLVIIDWDGSGRDDILVPNTSTGTWYLIRSTGVAFSAPVNTSMAYGSTEGWVVTDPQGDGLSDLAYNISGTWRLRLHQGAYPDLLKTATDGYGNAVTFNYAPLTSANYTKYSDATFPERDYIGPLHVVNSYSAADGIGGTYTNTFHYFGARLHLQGRGFEGFYSRRSQDSRNSLYAYAYFNRAFPYTGTPKEQKVLQSNNSTVITRTVNTWTSHTYGTGYETRKLPYISNSSNTRHELGGIYDGAQLSSSSTTNMVDSSTGTLTNSVMTVTEPSTANGVLGGASYTLRTYHPTLFTDATNWCIGRPSSTQSIQNHSQYGGGQITRQVDTDWDGLKCRPTSQTVQPGDAQWQAAIALQYDEFGNLSSESVTGAGMTARETTLNWGTTGQFPRSVTNALSHTAQLQWDAAKGVQTRQTDPNGVVASWAYDAFGRRTREDRPDGTATTWAYSTCSGCDPRVRLRVTEKLLDTADAVVRTNTTDLDAFNRSIYEYRQTLSGANAVTRRGFDALGRRTYEYFPYFSGSSGYQATFSYDALNRVTQLSRPTSDSNPAEQSATIDYEGLTVRATDPLGKQATQVADVLGRVIRSTDHDGYYQNFDYTAFGELLRVTDSTARTLLTNTYNIRGMLTAQDDLARGLWAFQPNALGEVRSVRDPNTGAPNWTTLIDYDALGRVTSRQDVLEGVTSTWTWGTDGVTANNVGRLASLSGAGYSEGYTYDSIGRLSRTTVTADASYQIDYAYNSIGKRHALTYPTTTSGYRLKLQYDYQYGHLVRVKDYNAPTYVFWQGNATDARGHFIDEQLGNGLTTLRGFDQVTGRIDFVQSGPGGTASVQNLSYVWDPAGNLAERRDGNQNVTEAFGYDNLHRLTSSTRNGVTNLTVQYDERGHILFKTDASTTSAPSDGTISWYSYHMPKVIGSGTSSSQFLYTPNRARYKQVANAGGTLTTTIYIGGLIEKVTAGATTEYRHIIPTGSISTGLYTRRTDGTTSMYYVTRDHLGSASAITNNTGTTLVNESFSAFGERRGANWSGKPSSADMNQIATTTPRGFTDHEHLDHLSLIHMNGRVYDPAIGRFISADPFIDGASNTQGWNRYAYVKNRALSFIDPSGYTTDQPDLTKCVSECIPPAPAGPVAPLEEVVTTGQRNQANLAAFLNQSSLTALQLSTSGPALRTRSEGGGGGRGTQNDAGEDDDKDDSTEDVIEEVVTEASRCTAGGGYEGGASITDRASNAADLADQAVVRTFGSGHSSAAVSGYYRQLAGRIDVASDLLETFGDASNGDTGRAAAGVADTLVNFGGKTPLTFTASVAYDEAGGARGFVDNYRRVEPVLRAGPIATAIVTTRAMRANPCP